MFQFFYAKLKHGVKKHTVQLFKTVKMAKINTEIQYGKALERIDELLLVVDNQTFSKDSYYVKLSLLSDLVAEYEEIYFPVEKPSLPGIIRLRMAELKIDADIILG